MKITHATVLLVMTMISGCASDAAYKDVFTIKTFSAPLRQKLQVPTGDALFVDGAIIEGEVINIASPVEKMIPGSMFIPFPIRIESGLLEMTTVTSRWKPVSTLSGEDSLKNRQVKAGPVMLDQRSNTFFEKTSA